MRPVDGVPPPREISLCKTGSSSSPCDTTEYPKTLRLRFKNPAQIKYANVPPTTFYCEVSNSSDFSNVAFSTTFPYVGGIDPPQTTILKVQLSVPAKLVGIILYVRMRLPNDVGPGYFGASANGAAAFDRPSAPTIAAVLPVVHATEGPSLLISIRLPADIGDGGHLSAPVLHCLLYLSTSDDENAVFHSGSTPPSFYITSSPDAQTVNFTIVKSKFPQAMSDQVELLLRKGNIAYVWARVGNQADNNPLFFSDLSLPRSAQVAGVPGAVDKCTLALNGDLAVMLIWSTPNDKGLGREVYYPLDAYQYAQIDVKTFSLLQDIQTLPNDARHAVVTGLLKNKTYFFSIRALNGMGFGPWFQHEYQNCSLYPLLERPCTCGFRAVSVPGSPIIERLQQGDGKLIGLWQNPQDRGYGPLGPFIALRYEVQLENIHDHMVNSSNTVNSTNTTWSILQGHLSVGKYYRFRCRALSAAGIGNWSDWSSSTLVLILPSSPASMSIAVLGPPGPTLDFRVTFTNPLQTGNGDSTYPLLSFEIMVFLKPDLDRTSIISNQNITDSNVSVSSLMRSSCTNISQATTIGNGTTFTSILNDLIAGCTYRCSIRAKNVIGWGPVISYDLLVKVSTVKSYLCLLHS